MYRNSAKLIAAGISAAGMVVGLPLLAFAGQATTVSSQNISTAQTAQASTSVVVGGTVIMRVRFGSNGYTPAQRAEEIQQRVNKLLGQGPVRPADVTVSSIDALTAAVYVKGQLLFTATEATARFNDTTPLALAEQWASTMRVVLPDLTYPTG